MNAWLNKTFREAAWAPLGVFITYAVAAKGFDAYLHYPWLDIPTHFFGGLAITYFFLVAITHSQTLIDRIPKLIQLLVSLGLTAMTAIAWEFLEYISDVALSTKMNLGVLDTLSDLFFGLLGGAMMANFAARTKRILKTTADDAHMENAP